MLILGLQKTTLLDYPGKIASTIFTGGCNFKCPYCHNRDLVFPPADAIAYSEEEILNHLIAKKKVLDGVCITGGEPTLHKALPEFISKIKDLGLLVKLDSNGTNPKMIKDLVNNGLIDYVAMDIKHSKEKYNSIANMQHFDIAPINESIEFLKEGRVDYEFRTTVIRECHTSSDFENIGNWIRGAKAYYLQSYRESEQVINPIFSSYSPEELQAFAELLRTYIPNTQLRGID